MLYFPGGHFFLREILRGKLFRERCNVLFFWVADVQYAAVGITNCQDNTLREEIFAEFNLPFLRNLISRLSGFLKLCGIKFCDFRFSNKYLKEKVPHLSSPLSYLYTLVVFFKLIIWFCLFVCFCITA